MRPLPPLGWPAQCPGARAPKRPTVSMLRSSRPRPSLVAHPVLSALPISLGSSAGQLRAAARRAQACHQGCAGCSPVLGCRRRACLCRSQTSGCVPCKQHQQLSLLPNKHPDHPPPHHCLIIGLINCCKAATLSFAGSRLALVVGSARVSRQQQHSTGQLPLARYAFTLRDYASVELC